LVAFGYDNNRVISRVDLINDRIRELVV
jgi:hypothetical protein